MSTIKQIMLAGDVVVAMASSNVLADGFAEVDDDVYASLTGLIGRARFVDGHVVPYVPPTPEEPIDPRANFVPVSILRQRIEKLGMWEGFAAYLVLNPTDMLKVLTVEDGLVDPDYPALMTAFDQLDVPAEAQAYILANRSVGAPDV